MTSQNRIIQAVQCYQIQIKCIDLLSKILQKNATPLAIYSAVRVKPDKKYLKFFWVFPQITRVMRLLSIENYYKNASQN